MINPQCIIDYNRSDIELERLILFLAFVAGKNADVASHKLEQFLHPNNNKPFSHIRQLIISGRLELKLRECKVGQYRRITGALTTLALLYTGAKLRTITVEELERVYGIGPKSARCFVSWTQPNTQYAMLDTHILKYLKNTLLVPNIPKSTPTGKAYTRLENIFLDHAKKLNRDPTELDLEIWKSYRKLSTKI